MNDAPLGTASNPFIIKFFEEEVTRKQKFKGYAALGVFLGLVCVGLSSPLIIEKMEAKADAKRTARKTDLKVVKND